MWLVWPLCPAPAGGILPLCWVQSNVGLAGLPSGAAQGRDWFLPGFPADSSGRCRFIHKLSFSAVAFVCCSVWTEAVVLGIGEVIGPG